MEPSILVLMACLSSGECIPVIGAETSRMQCVATSQQLAAAWIGDHPAYTIRGLACVDPRKLSAILGRTEA
jgi:hypothetical protein